MLGRRVDPLLATQHVGDLHQVIIHHVGQVVGRHAIGLEQDLRIDLGPLDLDLAAQHVLDHTGTAFRHVHADDEGRARRFTTCHFFCRQREIGRLERHVQTFGLARLAQLVQLFTGAIALEGMAGIDQLLAVPGVDVATLTLTVRAVRTADIRAFGPFDAQPAQRIEDHLLGFAGGTRLIGILDTQNELATVLTSEALVEQGDVGGADVGITSRRRCDARTNGHVESSSSRREGNKRLGND